MSEFICYFMSMTPEDIFQSFMYSCITLELSFSSSLSDNYNEAKRIVSISAGIDLMSTIQTAFVLIISSSWNG